MLNKQDRPLLVALLAVVLSLWVNVAASSVESPHTGTQNTTDQKSQKQGGEMTPLVANWSADDTIALFTGITAFIFFFQLMAMWRTNKHYRVSERAYVKLSHHAPGVYWEFPAPQKVLYSKDNRCWIRCDLEVKNFGKTPSGVYEIRVGHLIVAETDPVPEEPDYSSPTIETTDAFLVTGNDFNQPVRREITRETFQAIYRGHQALYLFARVEYRDKFGACHRGSYARRYAREADSDYVLTLRTGETLKDEDRAGRNNLVFISKRGLNNDVTRNCFGIWH
jgi:hypothetical protein